MSWANRELHGHRIAGVSRGYATGFRLHLDGVAWALFETHRAAGAKVIFVSIKTAFAELGDRLLRARCVAVVAFETIAAGQAAARLVARLLLGKPSDDLFEARALGDRSYR